MQKPSGSYLRFDLLLTKKKNICYIIDLFILIYHICDVISHVISCGHPITLQGQILFTYHRKSNRVLFNIPHSSSSKPSFYENSVLNIYQINDFLTATFKYVNNLMPQSLKKKIFILSSDNSYDLNLMIQLFIHIFMICVFLDKCKPEAFRTTLKNLSL